MIRPALAFALAAFATTALAADPKPEINRPVAKPQVAGAVHTLRTFPEACARIEGVFTGKPADPYRFAVVNTDPRCHARADLVDAKKVKVAGGGWVFNDLVRVPSAECPSRMAVVRVWRENDRKLAPPSLDAQGRARVYLKDAKAAEVPGAVKLPRFAVAMSLEGKACN